MGRAANNCTTDLAMSRTKGELTIEWLSAPVLFNRTASYSIGQVSSLPSAAGAVHAVAAARRAQGTTAATTAVRGGQWSADRSAPVPLAGLVSWCSFLGVTNLSYWTGAAGEPTERAAAAALCTD